MGIWAFRNRNKNCRRIVQLHKNARVETGQVDDIEVKVKHALVGKVEDKTAAVLAPRVWRAEYRDGIYRQFIFPPVQHEVLQHPPGQARRALRLVLEVK